MRAMRAPFSARPSRPLWLLAGWAIVALIVWLSLTPNPPKLDFEQSDKAGHFLAYGTVMFWFCQAYAGLPTRLAFGAGFIAMGVALEYLQRAVGYHSFEFLDMVADALGVLAGGGVATMLPRLLKD